MKKGAVILIYRPEARLDPDASRDENPFDGVDVAAVAQADTSEGFVKLVEPLTRLFPTAKFHIIEVGATQVQARGDFALLSDDSIIDNRKTD